MDISKTDPAYVAKHLISARKLACMVTTANVRVNIKNCFLNFGFQLFPEAKSNNSFSTPVIHSEQQMLTCFNSATAGLHQIKSVYTFPHNYRIGSEIRKACPIVPSGLPRGVFPLVWALPGGDHTPGGCSSAARSGLFLPEQSAQARYWEDATGTVYWP